MEENELKSAPAVFQAVIQITRKATGKVEEYTLTGTPLPIEQPAEQPKENTQ